MCVVFSFFFLEQFARLCSQREEKQKTLLVMSGGKARDHLLQCLKIINKIVKTLQFSVRISVSILFKTPHHVNAKPDSAFWSISGLLRKPAPQHSDASKHKFQIASWVLLTHCGVACRTF